MMAAELLTKLLMKKLCHLFTQDQKTLISHCGKFLSEHITKHFQLKRLSRALQSSLKSSSIKS